MELLDTFFGHDETQNAWQMAARAAVVFIITLIFLRFSGRRSFGMCSPVDNVINILLGAVLARAITGSSPFVPTVSAALVIALLHRFFTWLGLYSNLLGSLVKGDALVIYRNGQKIAKNMKKCFITDRDLMEGLRLEGVQSLDEVDSAYVERSGRISVIKKKRTA